MIVKNQESEQVCEREEGRERLPAPPGEPGDERARLLLLVGLREALAAGVYEIPADQVAEKIIDRAIRTRRRRRPG